MCSGLSALFLRKLNFKTMLIMELQKATVDSQNKENINNSHMFIVLQTQVAFFSGS